ncbi:hypothetical protein EV188_103251 [Actinomycetospora succinea]|uniref:Dolichyl-phosphate-mannose-protein mannosyltransferase n=1 Tax=Actinomycetospora succinea TaxID=663603 RepID=A0A4R6VE34_9PSEU|nr:hypothetical protein [Actinomycetospora succinea]TDQ60749.1 hypothetical protein EV188_103251 [Actinomycetospora succinea]
MAGATVPVRPVPVGDLPRPSAPRRRQWVDAAVAGGLYLAAAAWFMWLAAAASAQGVITGEEASVAHRDAMAIAMGWQPSVWSTNVAGQLFYWAAGLLTPEYGLLSPRPAKAVATALLVPLVFLVMRRRLGATRSGSAVAAVAVGVLPGVSMLAWLAIETPLDTVVGVAAVYVLTSRRPWWPLGLVLAGLSVSAYTAGLAWAAAAAVIALARVRGPRDGALVLAGVVGGVAVVVWPLVWWNNGGVVVTGGGRAGPDPGAAGTHLAELVRYLAVDGGSYYYFSDLPMLGASWLAAVLVLTLLVAVVARLRELAPWLLVGLAAVALYTVSSGVPGSRRVVALVVVLALGLGVTTDVLVRAVREHGAGRLGAAAGAVVTVLATLLVAVPSVDHTLDWRRDTVAGVPALPRDWPFPTDPGATQQQTLDRLDRDLRQGLLTPRQVGDGWGGTRVLALLFLLAERNGRRPALGPDDVVGYYWRGEGECGELGDC